MRIHSFVAALSFAALVPAVSRSDVITDFNTLTVGTQIKLKVGSNQAARALAIAHIAAHDAVVAITHTSEPYEPGLVATLPASSDAAALAAFHDVLVALYPTEQAAIDQAYTEGLAGVEEGAAKTNGVSLGAASAAAILAARAEDGSAATVVYEGGDALGTWRPTPRADTTQAPLSGLDPQWGDVTPFALTSPSQFRAAAPPALGSPEYVSAYNDVKKLGGKTSTARTSEQTKIANFWKHQTQIPFNAIARSLSNQKHLSLAENARLFALLNIALADSRIAIWSSKYEHTFWRPITAITVSNDGVAGTASEPGWLPLLETPNHPSYVSGHSGTGSAGATLLALYFGSDAQTFSVSSPDAPGESREFSSLYAAARENADSRRYGGIHFKFDNERGLELGTQIATYTFENYLALPPQPPPDDIGEGGQGGQGGAPATGGSTADTGGSESLGGAPTASGGNSTGATGEAGSPPEDEGTPPPAAPADEDDGCSIAGAPITPSSGGFVTFALGAALTITRRVRRRTTID
jgi:hypothetical protein